MTTGTWPQIADEIVDSAPRPREAWTLGLTRRGRPPRDTTARRRRQLVVLILGYGLVGGAVLRMFLLGVT